MIKESKQQIPQIKICGLTDASQACECAALGADAIGCVFYPKSPRHVTAKQARDIASALPPETACIGVFVNAAYDDIMKKVVECQLSGVQLHGQESPGLVDRLRNEQLLVIKAFFESGEPSFTDTPLYHASAVLVELGKGKLPGGNALAWDWKKARSLGETYPLILAGGISEDNVAQAIAACAPDAIDISSGVESIPGQKDMAKVKSFIARMNQSGQTTNAKHRKLRRIFNGKPNPLS